MSPRLSAAVAVLLAALLLSACGGVGNARAQAAPSSCPVSSATQIVLSSEDTRELRFGGSLASPSWVAAAPSGTKGELWAYRTDEPQFFVELEAHRLGGSERVRFQLLRTGTTVPPITWPGGGRGYLYGTSQRQSAFTPVGCWRVNVIGGNAEDEIFLEVR